VCRRQLCTSKFGGCGNLTGVWRSTKHARRRYPNRVPFGGKAGTFLRLPVTRLKIRILRRAAGFSRNSERSLNCIIGLQTHMWPKGRAHGGSRSPARGCEKLAAPLVLARWGVKRRSKRARIWNRLQGRSSLAAGTGQTWSRRIYDTSPWSQRSQGDYANRQGPRRRQHGWI